MLERVDRLTLSTFEQLTMRTPARWIVHEVLREESVAMWYGKRGGYKSFLALDLAAHIASGKAEWHGQPIIVNGLVIYIAAEGAGGMSQRVGAWAQYHQVKPHLVRMLFVTEPAVIAGDSADVELLVERIRQKIDWRPAGSADHESEGEPRTHAEANEWPVLIVIDTLARCFVGNENAQEDMIRFIQGVDRLRQEFDCSVLFVHHSGRKDTSHARGSTVHEASADTVFVVKRGEGAADRLTLTCDKMKDSKDGHTLVFGFHEVPVERFWQDINPEPLTSVVITDGVLLTIDRIAGCIIAGAETRDDLRQQLPDISDGLLRQTLNRYRDKRVKLIGDRVTLI